MIKAAFIIPLFITSCICQFAFDLGMKPDVTFGERNDRFDVASIIRDQNRMDIDRADGDYRRHKETYRSDKQKNKEIDNNFEKNEKNDKENEKNSKENVNKDKETNNDARENKIELGKGVVILDALKDTVDHLDIRRNFPSYKKIRANPDPEVVAYEKNLEAFRENPQPFTGKRRSNLQRLVNRLHSGLHSGRRGIPPDPENEILFHYGVPVIMKVAGFIQVPLENNVTGEPNTN